MSSNDTLLANVIEWDVHNWGTALTYWTRHSRRGFAGCRALEVGGRNGGLSLWLALQGAEVVCSDLRGFQESALRLHREYGVADRISYVKLDATSMPYRDCFDVIAFKSVLGGIGSRERPDRQVVAVREMHQALRQDGELLFAENLVASPVHAYFRRRKRKWGQTWRYLTVSEMLGFLAPFAEVEYRTLGFAGAFGRTESQRRLLGSLDRAFMDSVVPPAWRYIIQGVARK